MTRVAFEKYPIKNSIRFSFNLTESIKTQKLSQIYLHCFPEICTDHNEKQFIASASISINKNKQKSLNSFYSQFKSCQNISNSCLSNKGLEEASEDNTSLINNENNHNLQEKIRISDDLYGENFFVPLNDIKCINKFTIGPIHLRNSEENHDTEHKQNKTDKNLKNASANLSSTSFNFLSKYSFIVFMFFNLYSYLELL
jgi:hypothetical protein